MDLFDIAAAREARDDGIDRVMEGEEAWKDKAQRWAIAAFRPGWEGLFEEIRRDLKARGIEEPHAPQCWSALSLSLLHGPAFERIEDWDQPKGVKSHGSAYRKMRRTGYLPPPEFVAVPSPDPPKPSPDPRQTVAVPSPGIYGNECAICGAAAYFGIREVWYCRDHRPSRS